MLNQANYSPALAQDVPSTVTWASGNTKTVSDANVKASSHILIMATSVPIGRWAVTVTAGQFVITSSDAESNATFIYKIL